MKKYEVEVENVEGSSLLMNRFVSGTDLSPTKRKVITTRVISIEDKMYKTDKGKIYVPARYFEGSLTEAGKNFKGKGRTNLSKIMGAMISIMPDALVLNNQKWIEDMQVGVNPMTKGRMEIHRPRFDKWGVSFTLIVSMDDLPTETMKEILDYAGLYVGVGDWRPAKKGKYGKFIVTKFKEV